MAPWDITRRSSLEDIVNWVSCVCVMYAGKSEVHVSYLEMYYDLLHVFPLASA